MATDIRVPTMGESVTKRPSASGSRSRATRSRRRAAGRTRDRQGRRSRSGARPPASSRRSSQGRRDRRIGALLAIAERRRRRRRCPPRPSRACRHAAAKPPPAPARRAGAARPQGAARPSVRKHRRRSRRRSAGIAGSGKGGRVTKGDALAIDRLRAGARRPRQQLRAPPAARRLARRAREDDRLRQTIARRLKEAQNTAAMLTTFNEVDMTR
jgi:2-oxoglutarate dehydrogenase E2 component (dihydrolipoamide succinyltransferase)